MERPLLRRRHAECWRVSLGIDIASIDAIHVFICSCCASERLTHEAEPRRGLRSSAGPHSQSARTCLRRERARCIEEGAAAAAQHSLHSIERAHRAAPAERPIAPVLPTPLESAAAHPQTAAGCLPLPMRYQRRFPPPWLCARQATPSKKKLRQRFLCGRQPFLVLVCSPQLSRPEENQVAG